MQGVQNPAVEHPDASVVAKLAGGMVLSNHYDNEVLKPSLPRGFACLERYKLFMPSSRGCFLLGIANDSISRF